MSQSIPLKTMAQRNDSWYVDSKLLVPALALLSIGLIMVASSSFSYADHRFNDQFYFVKRHFAYLLLSIGAIAVLPTCQYLNLFQSSCVALAFAWRNHRGKDHKKGDTNFNIGFHISFMGKKNDFAKSLCREQIESYIIATMDQHPARFLKVCLNQTRLWT